MKKMKLNIQLFASGTIFESSDGKLRAKLTWSSSINEDGLGSTITATLSVRRTSGSGTTGTFKYNMEIDGETWSGSKKLTSLGTSYKEVASKTKSINYSGSYSAYLYAKVNGPTDTSLDGLSVNGEGYATLDATTYPATLNSVNVDNFVSQGKFTPYFTENQQGLYYGMGIISYTPIELIVSWSDTIAVSNGVEATLSDAQKQTLWNVLDGKNNRTANDIKFVLYSYSDSARTNEVGTTDIDFINSIAIPNYSLNWNWNITTIEDIHRNNQYGNHPLSYYAGNNYVKGLSLPKIYFNATSSTGYTYGKTITYTLNGVARTSPYEDTSWSGENTYTLTASDGRASPITTTITINVVNYFIPYLSNIRVVRPIPTDDVVRVSYTANYYDGTNLSNLTNATYNFYYRENESDSWTFVNTLSGSGTSGSQTYTNVDIDNLNYKKPFYYKIEFTDRIGNTMAVNPYIANIPKGLPVWNAYVNSSDDNVFNVNGELQQETDGKYFNSQYDGSYYWQFDTDAPEFRFNKQVVSSTGLYTNGNIYSVGNITASGNINANNLARNFTLLKDFGSISSYDTGYAQIDTSDYDLIIITTQSGLSAMVFQGGGAGMLVDETWTNNADNFLKRNFWNTSNNDIQIDKCYGYGINGYNSFGERPNSLVPRYIYGIKLR